jgi:hypothetical protein
LKGISATGRSRGTSPAKPRPLDRSGARAPGGARAWCCEAGRRPSHRGPRPPRLGGASSPDRPESTSIVRAHVLVGAARHHWRESVNQGPSLRLRPVESAAVGRINFQCRRRVTTTHRASIAALRARKCLIHAKRKLALSRVFSDPWVCVDGPRVPWE